jgi:hypothetical protein
MKMGCEIPMDGKFKLATGPGQARIDQGTAARIKLQCLLPELRSP